MDYMSQGLNLRWGILLTNKRGKLNNEFNKRS